MQQWQFLGQTMRNRTLCDLPPPDIVEEGRLRDRDAMDINPFPGFWENSEADTIEPNLLEEHMGYPQEKPSSSNDSIEGSE